MGGTLGGAAGGGGLCQAQVRWAPAVRAYQVAAQAPLEIVGFLGWQGFAPLELAAAPLEVGGHPQK